jgi:hypothetical protein
VGALQRKHAQSVPAIIIGKQSSITPGYFSGYEPLMRANELSHSGELHDNALNFNKLDLTLLKADLPKAADETDLSLFIFNSAGIPPCSPS